MSHSVDGVCKLDARTENGKHLRCVARVPTKDGLSRFADTFQGQPIKTETGKTTTDQPWKARRTQGKICAPRPRVLRSTQACPLGWGVGGGGFVCAIPKRFIPCLIRLSRRQVVSFAPRKPKPDFHQAMGGVEAEQLYEAFNATLRESGAKVSRKRGVGSKMGGLLTFSNDDTR